MIYPREHQVPQAHGARDHGRYDPHPHAQRAERLPGPGGYPGGHQGDAGPARPGLRLASAATAGPAGRPFDGGYAGTAGGVPAAIRLAAPHQHHHHDDDQDDEQHAACADVHQVTLRLYVPAPPSATDTPRKTMMPARMFVTLKWLNHTTTPVITMTIPTTTDQAQ